MSDTITICPECGTPDMWNRSGQNTGRGTDRSVARYRCRNGHEFDEPDEKEPDNPGATAAAVLERNGVDLDKVPGVDA